jgi:hypothetical protein
MWTNTIVPGAGSPATVRTTVLDVREVPVACHPGHRRCDFQVTAVTVPRFFVSPVTGACALGERARPGRRR